MDQTARDRQRNQLEAIVASETNRLVLRDGSYDNQHAKPRPASSAASVATSASVTSAAEVLAPGIVGAVAFFLVMFALVAAYWRCGRLDDSRRRRQRRQRPWTTTAEKETEGGGCRIIVNPLEEEIEMIPSAQGTQQRFSKSSNRRQHFKSDDNHLDINDDFDDMASLLSSSSSCGSSSNGDSSGDEVDENCEQCRREARLASPEEAAVDSKDDEVNDEDCCYDANDTDIGFADDDEDEAAADDDEAMDDAESESVRLIQFRWDPGF